MMWRPAEYLQEHECPQLAGLSGAMVCSLVAPVFRCPGLSIEPKTHIACGAYSGPTMIMHFFNSLASTLCLALNFKGHT